jgi:hypothetical protein
MASIRFKRPDHSSISRLEYNKNKQHFLGSPHFWLFGFSSCSCCTCHIFMNVGSASINTFRKVCSISHLYVSTKRLGKLDDLFIVGVAVCCSAAGCVRLLSQKSVWDFLQFQHRILSTISSIQRTFVLALFVSCINYWCTKWFMHRAHTLNYGVTRAPTQASVHPCASSYSLSMSLIKSSGLLPSSQSCHSPPSCTHLTLSSNLIVQLIPAPTS